MLQILFLDEFKGRAKVLLRKAIIAHGPVDLVGERAEGGGSTGARSRVLRQSQVLGHQGRAETTLNITGNEYRKFR